MDNFAYYSYQYPDDPFIEDSPQRTFGVINWKTKNGAQFSNTYSYYDDHGNLIFAKYYDYDRSTYVPAAYAYNQYGQLTWAKNANSNKTNYLSDEWGRLKKITDPQGNYHAFNYDIYNRTKITTFTPAGGTAENHYVETSDQWGQIVSRKGYPNGPGGTAVEEKYEYDLSGNLIKLTDPNHNITRYSYDALNRLVKVTNALGEITDYDYDRLGDLTQVKQYQGTTPFPTTKQYSERGVLVAKQRPAGQPITYKYNANGLPVETKDAAGKITTMQYYPDNSLAVKRANQDRIQYYYHPLGNVEKYQPINDVTGNGEALTYSYYSSGLVKMRAGVAFQYDLVGNRTKITDPFGFATNYQYNNLNRLTTVTADSKNFTYEYYGDGMVKAVNYPQLTGGTSIRTEYTYDNINRLKTLKNKLGSQTIDQYSYNYDNNSNITSVTENGQTTNYTYDALNRLIGIQRPGGEQISYQYDSRGNRIIVSVNDKSLDGFIPGDFSYNNWDELATFTTGGTTSNYYYDPEGLRTKKVTSSGTTRYYYDTEDRVITESSNGVIATARTTWGKQALARKTSGNYYYYLYNGHGDVTKVIDQNGNIINSYTYDEWGNILAKQEQLAQPLKYAGEYLDDESGLYYLRARYYDPTIGRFISRDSYEGDITNPLTLNPYTYVENDPLGNIDPSGHFSIGIISSVIKTAVSVAKSIAKSSSSSSRGSNKSKSSSGTSATRTVPGVLVASLNTSSIIKDAWSTAEEYAPRETGMYKDIYDVIKLWLDTPVPGVSAGAGIIKGIKGTGNIVKGTEKFNFTNTTAKHMDDAGRSVPIQTLNDAIKSGIKRADPQGTSAKMYYTTMSKNKKMYNLEVLYDSKTNTIMHFKYTSEAIGPLPKIVK